MKRSLTYKMVDEFMKAWPDWFGVSKNGRRDSACYLWGQEFFNPTQGSDLGVRAKAQDHNIHFGKNTQGRGGDQKTEKLLPDMKRDR